MPQLLNDIYAVILAGGSGTRFWPLSRETCPKQMLQIVGGDTLLRQTIKRIDGFVPPENIWIVTTEDMGLDIRFHLESFGELAERFKFIKEPIGRNTAPAIALAAVCLNHLFPQTVMVVMPSDHAVPDREKFLSDLELAIQGAREDHLVTFGIRPSRPETGYGYIQVENASTIGRKGLRRVGGFVEKPDLETAKKYLSDGSYYWNSGIFIWKTSKILSEIRSYLPDLYKGLKEIEPHLFESDQLNQLSELYSHLESISIDYGIMERSQDVLMVPASFQWSDLGSWSALDDIVEKDNEGNILRGNTIDIGSQNSTIYGSERLVATIGLEGMVVVDTPDATLVTPKERVQEVRKIVEVLKQNGREEHLLHKTVERPWGSYTVLEKGEGYKIKRVVLKPGAKLSVQLHRKRSEHWVVVKGTARVTKENDSYLVHSNESTYIPIGVKHRLENLGEIPLQVIEVQNGQYLEEDDIERFDDIYGRT
jgi:mannose-1-phosphate guanylyltransferase/mannose-6-phosphate isomerase